MVLFSSIYDYEKLEVLGEGTYGVVYKARDRRTGQTVAVKWVLGEGEGGHGTPDLRAVGREAGCLAVCRGHPSVVQILDVAADARTGDVFLVMEFVGPCLRDFIGAPFSVAEIRGMMRQLLGGVKAMHGAGVIHRDVKPENILVGPDGALKICDFGMATPAKPAGTPYGVGEASVGTLWYRSPEQLVGSRCYGPAVDVWALGCVMVELLTGAPVFGSDTEEDLLAEVCDMRDEISSTGSPGFEGLPELSQAGREVLAGLLAFYPNERLTAAEALEHRWFTEEAESPAVAADMELCIAAAGLTLES